MVIKRVEPLSLAKVLGIGYAALGLILGVLEAIVLAVIGMLGRASGPEASLGVGLISIMIIIGAPIACFILGFIAGLINAAIYNLVARFVGGVRIEVETEPAVSQPPLMQTGQYPILEN